MKKIKIEPSEAGEWMSQGYEIECYALVQPTKITRKSTHRTPAPRRAPVPQTAMVAISVEANQDIGGLLGEVWKKVKEELWGGKNVTKTYTRKRLEKSIIDQGGKKGMSSEFLFRYNTVRVVTDE